MRKPKIFSGVIRILARSDMELAEILDRLTDDNIDVDLTDNEGYAPGFEDDEDWPMTFEEFQKTKREVVDLNNAINGFESDEPWPGLVYCDTYYIEESRNRERGAWCLEIFNEATWSDDLEMLERKLYDFAVTDGGL